MAFATEVPPGTASVVAAPPAHEWGDDAWMTARAADDPLRPARCRSTRCTSARGAAIHDDDGGWRPLTYRELAEQLPDYVADLGFTHVELMPVAEHPFGGSWGYQVSAYYAPTARFGTPDDFRVLVDALHQRGIGVIVDWVPAHFPADEFALARFDGTALYEHADPRQGEHPDWGTLVFNFGRNEVRNFLVANALYWLEEFHIDGLRVDAVASMLYLDYSRKAGRVGPQPVRRPGEPRGGRLPQGGQRDGLRRATRAPSTIAEESTAWPGVSRPTYLGGLGFGFKWNMGWMHDTLDYFSHDPIFRRYHHNELTFGLLYAWSGELRAAALPRRGRARQGLAARQDAGRPVAAAGQPAGPATPGCGPTRASSCCSWAASSAQEREWSHDRSLDWHLLHDPAHRGIQDLVAVAEPRLPGPAGPVGAGLHRRRASGGSTPTTPTTACCRSCASAPALGRP